MQCLSSLTKLHEQPPFSLLVIDNGSTDGSVAAIRSQFSDLAILQTGENLGYAGGNNAGLRWALEKPYEWILLLNNDTTVAPDLLEQLERAIQKNPSAKILGTIGRLWDPSVGEYMATDHQKVDMVCGSTFLIHRTVPETIGFLDERFFLMWEEADYCARAKRAGYEIVMIPEAKVHHEGSASFTGGKPHLQYFWWRNRLLWIARNCSWKEKRKLYRHVILPEMVKWARHSLLKNLQILFSSDSKRIEKARRYRAGLRGILDYFLGRFGNCPIAYTRRHRV